ncbi:hypothetical protein BC835DRAFT_1329341 [Cytidiella melzeri]|nr:hypothetical protein BC835DRAFT_1329341 [Cytidiella melzeri]
MKFDYFPLSQTSSSSRQHFSELELEDSFRDEPTRRKARRRLIFGGLTAAALVALWFIAGEVVDFADTFYDDEDLDLLVDSRVAYLPFEPPPKHDFEWPDIKTIKLTPTQELPDHCRDAYFSKGDPCYDPVIKPMDVVWTWVNGSDRLLQEAKLQAENSFSPDDPFRPKTSITQSRQYRDNDELRHSMRSVLSNYRPYIHNFHLVSSDFALPQELAADSNVSYPAHWRLGQIPQWLDISTAQWRDGNVHLNVVHHADIFRPYPNNSFNSYAIEAQFSRLPNVSEQFIYLNDDFYLSNPVTPRTFFTSVYGMVLRFDTEIMISPEKPSPTEDRNELRSMGESSYLISERFGARHRPYVLHEAKAVSLAIVRELSAMWPTSIAAAAVHPFRETVSGSGDVSVLFLMVHFVVERWREALLWSWVVARNGGLEDQWNADIMAGAWAELGGQEGEKELYVKMNHRLTLDDDRAKAYFRVSGHHKSDSTWYRFSSWDGYPYAYINEDDREWPSFRSNEKAENLPECTVSYEQCFVDEQGSLFTRATDILKNIAFREPQCGDCVIQALVRASGQLGLEAFLPPADRHIPRDALQSNTTSDDVPHLPLDPKWKDVDFSLRAVVDIPGMNIREWTLRLMQRYRFVVGHSPYVFVMLENLDNTRGALDWLDSYEEVSMVCVNDDVPDGPGQAEVSEYFVAWQDKRFNEPAAWERRQ